jgi:type IV pilus assembly protein PilB
MMIKSSPPPAAKGPALSGKPKKRLGEALLEAGVIDRSQLEEGLKLQARTKGLLGAALLKSGHVTQEDVARAIADANDLEYIDLEASDIGCNAADLISRQLAERFNTVPLRVAEGRLLIACDTPLTAQVKGNLQRLIGMPCDVCLSTTSRIQGVLKEVYDGGGTCVDLSEDAAIIKLVDGIIDKAVRERVSDIHFEPGRENLRVRFRVDGLLREIETHPMTIAPPLISRIKVLSNLNIAEKRSPQDGALSYSKSGDSIDIRVSVLPNIHGEKAVLRLLSTENRRTNFAALGMEPDNIEIFTSLIQRPHGIVLLASPTGSGKSTTLFATLRHLRSETTNITTVEDPVEYKVDGVTQVQVDQAMKVTFPTALRSILRQDPDIIMIGEIRDHDTAEIALQAALTGHLVLATIHTNDAPSALTRLVDMGCEPFLVSSTVCGIMAQRLIRMTCPQCKTPIDPTADELRRFGLEALPEGAAWSRGAGCRYCRESGYKDRIAICELCRVDREIQKEIVKNASAEKIRDVALANGMRSLFADGLIKVNRGITPPEEVMRVTMLE